MKRKISLLLVALFLFTCTPELSLGITHNMTNLYLQKKSKKKNTSGSEWVEIKRETFGPQKGKKYKEKTVITMKSTKTGEIVKKNQYKY